MQRPVTNPPVPYVGPIQGGFAPGVMIRMQGHVPADADRFNVNLHCGPPPSDIALHISVRLLQSYVARNSVKDGAWGTEEDNGSLPISPGEKFEILILCDPSDIKIAINGNHFAEFRHRIPFQKVSHLAIDGDVSLGIIATEGGSLAPGAPPMSAEGSDYGYGPPPGQYGPSRGAYGPSPYGGGPGYGPPQPPGYQEESGLDSFLETAGTVLAGAISSGVAQNLISGLTGSGGQQQHYQPPPPPPPPPQQLFNLGGQGSVGGLGSVGSLLQTFAGQVLAGPKKLPIQMPMPMPTSMPVPPPSHFPSVPAVSMPPLPNTTPAYAPSFPPASYGPNSVYGQQASMPVMPNTAHQPLYPHKKMKKSKLKKAMKYGLPIAGAGVGAYAISHAVQPGDNVFTSLD